MNEISKKHHAILLIGCPASGKSTFANDFIKTHTDYTIVSSDAFIEEFAKEAGMIYNNAAFEMFRGEAEGAYKDQLVDAIFEQKNIIIDRTNMTITARRKILSRLSRSYKKSAIVFDVSREIINQRLLNRWLDTGKDIPQNVVDAMLMSYETPTENEGFDEIINK